MTKDEFKNKYPEVFKEVKNEGVSQERIRIKGLDEISNFKGIEELIISAKYEDFKTANEIAIDILKNSTVVEKEGEAGKEEREQEQNLLDKFNNKKEDAHHLDEQKGGQAGKEKDVVDKDFMDEIVNIANGGV